MYIYIYHYFMPITGGPMTCSLYYELAETFDWHHWFFMDVELSDHGMFRAIVDNIYLS